MQLEVPLKKIRLEHARTELLLTQIELANRANVSVSVILNAEKGRAIRRLTAAAVLKALNQERTKEGLTPLDFQEMDWKIQGE